MPFFKSLQEVEDKGKPMRAQVPGEGTSIRWV